MTIKTTMMIRTSLSSIIYSTEFDDWIINWPRDTASQTFFLSIEGRLTLI